MRLNKIVIRDSVIVIARIVLFPILSIYYFYHIPKIFWGVKSFKLFIKLSAYYAVKLRRLPNLINPKSLNDYIQRLKLFNQSEEQITLSDKLLVKEWVKGFGIKELKLPRTLAVIQSYSEYQNLHLGTPHVLKVNHDSGGVELVNSEPFSIEQRKFIKLQKRLQHRFGDISGEWPYKYIEPKMFVEEFIDFKGKQPDDYKFYCVDGEVKFCHYIYGRELNTPFEKLVDRDGFDLGIKLHPKFNYGHLDFIKPSNWIDMIQVCELLSSNFLLVRIDLYSVDGSMYFGEITFFPQSGTYLGTGQIEVFDLIEPKPRVAQETIYI